MTIENDKLILKSNHDHKDGVRVNKLQLKYVDNGGLMIWLDCGHLGTLSILLDQEQQKELLNFVQCNIK